MGKENSSKSSRRAYATLEPRVRHISEAAVRKKWKKLGPGSQDHVKQLFLSLKNQSTVSFASRQKIDGSAPLVEEVAQRLLQRLPRMPFPPRTEESNFDFEATLDRVRLLENQLTANVNTMHLLRAQIAKEEKMLKLDREELGDLEDGLKSSELLRKRQNKTLHPLATSLEIELDPPGFRQQEHPVVRKISVLELQADPDVAPLLQQMHNHLESMENNTTGTREIEEALTSAQTVLNIFSSSELDRQQFKQLYGLDTT